MPQNTKLTPMSEALIAEAWLLGRVVIAAVAGGVLGFERERENRSAGLRTHMLVAASSALFVGLAQLLILGFGDEAGSALRTDPIRVIEAVVAGVSFLGAGTIFVSGKEQRVRGLTTAASRLMAAGIGAAAALQAWILVVGTAALGWIILRTLQPVSEQL